MEYVIQSRDPARKITGLAMVLVLHTVIVLCLIHGLARRQVNFSPPAPIDWVSIVDRPAPAHKPPTPMPVVPHRAQVSVPPDVEIEFTRTPGDSISPPPGDAMPASVAMPAMLGPKAEVDSVPSTRLGAACPNAQAIRTTIRYPAQARREGMQGDVLASFIVGANGEIRDISIVRSANRLFNAAVIGAVRQFSCIAQGRDVTVEVPFSFRLE
ncbi:MAG: TonB family protein [Betaproteobacteria bacterium]